MSDGLTDLPRVGPSIADNLREAGYHSKRDVLEADPTELAEIHLIGETSAKTICGVGPETEGRPSKFDEVKDDLLEAADGYLNMEQIANRGGIHRATLFRYLDEHADFCDSFKRARGNAADRLVRRALDPTDEIDNNFARFLLERSFKFIKTERQEVQLDTDADLSSDRPTAEFVVIDESDDD